MLTGATLSLAASVGEHLTVPSPGTEVKSLQRLAAVPGLRRERTEELRRVLLNLGICRGSMEPLGAGIIKKFNINYGDIIYRENKTFNKGATR